MAGADSVVIGLLGVGLLLAGAGVASGRLWLLANYDPDAVRSERRVARLAGGAVIAFGLPTVGLAWGLPTGRADDWWWAGWGLAALATATGVASVVSGRA